MQVIGIDLQGVFHMSKACLPHLKKSGLASGDSIIINITATLMNTATPFQMHAAAAKAGINVLTQARCQPTLWAYGLCAAACSRFCTVGRALPPHSVHMRAEHGPRVGRVRHSRRRHRARTHR
jgi:NAD(P)-dependent dehydrogenase (short-subunit alcohol dehydrogenase family)